MDMQTSPSILSMLWCWRKVTQTSWDLSHHSTLTQLCALPVHAVIHVRFKIESIMIIDILYDSLRPMHSYAELCKVYALKSHI
jgi:hypothetical protein